MWSVAEACYIDRAGTCKSIDSHIQYRQNYILYKVLYTITNVDAECELHKFLRYMLVYREHAV